MQVGAFKIDRYEVTNRSYRKFVESTNRMSSAFTSDVRFNRPENPVVGVSWEDGRDYCRWVAGRLPTEVEWMKAGRGKDYRQTPWGSEDFIACNVIDRANINPVVTLKLYDWYGSKFAADADQASEGLFLGVCSKMSGLEHAKVARSVLTAGRYGGIPVFSGSLNGRRGSHFRVERWIASNLLVV